VLSAIMFGARVSLLVGLASVALAAVAGVSLGLAAGYLGGRVDAFIMRVADVQLSFPAILIALLIDGWPACAARDARRRQRCSC
jgi:peptide/nickel transport system permease protein